MTILLLLNFMKSTTETRYNCTASEASNTMTLELLNPTNPCAANVNLIGMNQLVQTVDCRGPLSLQEADAMWERLLSINSKLFSRYMDDNENVWVIGEQGNSSVVVTLRKDRRIGLIELRPEEWDIPKLPKVSYLALTNHLLEFCTLRGLDVQCPDEVASQIPKRLRKLFITNATQAKIGTLPVPRYDEGRQTLSLKSAEIIAEKAFRLAFKGGKPRDMNEFADHWAAVALLFVMGQAVDCSILTGAGTAQLCMFRERNIHRTKADLTTQTRWLDDMRDGEQLRTWRLTQVQQPDDRHFLAARRASCASFQAARARALTGLATNLKPFSQRFIKGMILAKVAQARVPIGKLSDAISNTLAACYGEALTCMQHVEIVAAGRMLKELLDPVDQSPVAGNFLMKYPIEVVLKIPRVLLSAEHLLKDQRTIFHEYQHARQYLAAEESAENFVGGRGRYGTQIIEWKAKLAEAEFMDKFGIFF